MPIRFKGFSTASTVTLSVASSHGRVSGPTTVSAWGVPPDGGWDGSAIDQTLTVTVEEILPTLDTAQQRMDFAPLGVEWRIKVSGSAVGEKPDISTDTGFGLYDPTVAKIHYVVHTGDSGSYANDWVADPAHRDKAFQYGQNPGHVYSTPGTYTGRSIYVYDEDGKWGTLALPDLEVSDPDVVIAPSQTILLASSGDFTGAPNEASVPAANKVTTVDAAFARFVDLRGTTGSSVRICAKAGDTFNEVSRVLDVQYTRGRILLDTWGGSGRVTYSERNTGIGGVDEPLFKISQDFCWPVAVKNWHFDFGWDAMTGGPSNDWSQWNGRGMWSSDDSRFTSDPEVDGMRTVWDNVEVEGCAGAMFTTKNPTYIYRRSAWFFNDCYFHDTNDYVIYQASNLFFLGCRGLETYGSDIGLMGRGRIGGVPRGYRGHRNLRETMTWVMYMRACYWEGRGGWSGQNSGDTGYSAQPLFRTHEASSSNHREGKRIYFCDNVFMGPLNVDLSSFYATTDTRGSNTVIENNLLVHDPMQVGTELLTGVCGGKAIRNNVFLILDTPILDGSSSPEYAGKDLSRFETPANKAKMGNVERFMESVVNGHMLNQPLDILHNSFISLRSSANLSTPLELINTVAYQQSDDTDPTKPHNYTDIYDVTMAHNVFSQPNIDTPSGPPLSTIDLPVGMRVLDMWMKTIWERTTFTIPAQLDPGQTSPEIPYPTGWDGTATVQADYAGSRGLHGVRIANPIQTYRAPWVTDPGVANIVSVSPGHNETNANLNDDYVIKFATAMNTGLGQIVIYRKAGDPVLFETINVSEGTWSDGDTTLTLARGANFAAAKSYFVLIFGMETASGTPVEILDQTAWTIKARNLWDYGQLPGTFNHNGQPNSTDALTVNFGATGLTVTNRSPHTWLAGALLSIILDRGTTCMAPDRFHAVDQSTFKLYRPRTPQATDSGVKSTLFDFQRHLRPGAGYAISPDAGTNAAGAILPA